MGFTFKGYVLEPPRVSQANSPFTSTPNNFVSNFGAYNAIYPTGSEPSPRADYFVVVLSDGLLVDATFGWTKNEVVARFDYDGRDQRFKLLPGSAPILLGTVTANLNTTRIKVPIPQVVASPAAPAPYRLSVGLGSGTTLSTTLVASFGSPAAGTVEILTATGELNWNPADFATYAGEQIQFQRQGFYAFKESTGLLGQSTDPLLLNPLPATGQIPLIRSGFGLYLTAVEKPNDASFSANPASGTVEWSVATGRLKFNSALVSGPVFYDGVLMATGLTLPRQNLGLITSPAGITNVPPDGGDIIFRIPGVRQFPATERVVLFDPFGQYGTVQLLVIGTNGSALFSEIDQIIYAGQSVQVVFGDLPIERGISMRFFRSPVNLDGSNPDVKDVTNVYTTEDATLADPIIGSPQVFLPAIPIDDPSFPIVVHVEQGTGFFPPGPLPRLDVLPLPVGAGPTIGYVLDLPNRLFQYAQRKNNLLVSLQMASGALVLPDPLIVPANFSAALETGVGTGIFVPLTLGNNALLDPSTGTLSFVTTQGLTIASGDTGTFSGTHFTDPLGSFGSVQPGDLLVIPAGAGEGVYTITGVSGTTLTVDVAGTGTNVAYTIQRGREILADRFWAQPLFIDPNTVVTRTPNGGPTQTLAQGVDYKLAAGFGLVSFTNRMLALEQASVTYSPQSGDGTILPPVTERATFLIRGEISQPHTQPTNIVTFNPLGRTVAATPAPAVRRGGRPQTSDQVLVDVTHSTVTFLPDNLKDNTLPHGSVVNPDERIYIDYYIYEAIGGEKSITVLQPPMFVAQVTLTDGSPSFTILGDQTSVIPAGYLIRVEKERVYYVGTSTFDPSTNLTTITLAAGAEFQDDLNAPNIYVSSGPIRVTPTPSFPSYFIPEMVAYDTIATGMNKVYLPGDRTSAYKAGVILYFTDGTTSFQEFYEVTGAAVNDQGKTEITLSANTLRQYTAGTHVLRYSARPILESSAKTVSTSKQPVMSQPILVYRRVEGQVGQILSTPADYTVNESGVVTFAPPLNPTEEIDILYTGHNLVPAGIRVKTSYTSVIAPDSTSNGLIGQRLQMDYSILSPDTFYYRVETRTNFMAEVAASISADAKSSVPSGGPNLSNSSGSKLSDQGRGSAFFDEEHYANEDLVAQAMLKFYNDATNYLEDVLQDMDGRVVGQASGRFLFDGNLNNPQVPTPPLPTLPPGPIPQPPANVSGSTNQIDDQVLLTPFPLDLTTFPPFSFIGTYVPVYQPGPLSRFYPTQKTSFGITIAGADTHATPGMEILDLKNTNITSISELRRRSPRARVMQPASIGSNTLYTTTLAATNTLLRPAFVVGQAVDILAEDGTPLFVNPTPDVSSTPVITVAAILTSPDRLVLNTPVLVPIPAGATVTAPVLEPLYSGGGYTPVGRIYTPGLSFWVNLEKGTLLFPIDLTVVGFPPPNSQERIQVTMTLGNASTDPTRFPALDGQALDDSGDESIPILSPSLVCEVNQSGFEQLYVGPGGKLLSPATTPPYVGTGSLNVAKTIITNSVSWPSPIPKVYDLVRITSGLNGMTSYRRITAVGANTITVDTAFATQDAGFSFSVTVSNTLATGTGITVTLAGSTLTDTAANFVSAGVFVGLTVVISAGTSVGDRRQVVSFTTTSITVDHPFTASGIASTYRVDNPLNTFSDLSLLASALTTGQAILSTNVAPAPPARSPVNAEEIALNAFFEYAVSDLLTPATQAGTVSGSVLTGAGSFTAIGVQKGDFVYIPTDGNGNAGFYQVNTVTSTTLTVATPFPTPAAVSYRVVRPFGVTQKKTYADLFTILQNVETYVASYASFLAEVTATVSVVVPGNVVDPNMFANALVPADVTARAALVASRLASLSDPAGPITQIQNVLKSTEKLYDKRWAWIDARVNLSTGFLPKETQARSTRLKNQRALVNHLYKLLSTQGNG